MCTFTGSHHHSGLGWNRGIHLFGALQQAQRAFVARARAGDAVKTRDGFGVVVQDVGPRAHHNAQRLVQSLKIGDKNLDAATWHAPADLANRFGEHARAAYVVIVAIDAGDHRELQRQLFHRFGDTARLVVINRLRTALGHGAKSAAARAQVAQQHERSGAMVPALPDVGAVRRLADGVQLQLARQGLQVVIVLAHGRARLQPLRFGSRTVRSGLDLDEFGSRGHRNPLLYKRAKRFSLFALRYSLFAPTKPNINPFCGADDHWSPLSYKSPKSGERRIANSVTACANTPSSSPVAAA